MSLPLAQSIKARISNEYHRVRTKFDWARFTARNPLAASECGLVAQWGIGDHYLVCALAHAVERETGLQVVVAGNPRYAFLANLFRGVKRYEPLPQGLINKECGRREIVPGAFSYAQFRGFELVRAFGYRGFRMIDGYRCLFRLDCEEMLETPAQPSPAELARGREILEEENLPCGKTAILCPEANSIPVGRADDAFWCRVAAELTDAGLTPVWNAGRGVGMIEGTRRVRIELCDFRAVAANAGYFFSVRSGLCDLVCDLAGCRKVVFYPDERSGYGSVYASASFESYSLADPPFEVILKEVDEFSWSSLPRPLRDGPAA
jgi:hypothetical protein